jgi:hypothetical protein
MNHFISLDEAIIMTSRYRDEKENITNPDNRGQNILCFSETFSKGAIQALLETDDCHAIRVYYGMDEGLKVHTLLVAVDSADKDILPDSQTQDAKIVEVGRRCPDYCPPPSSLTF